MKQTLDEMIAILQAAKEGKQIQVQLTNGAWIVADQPNWDFSTLLHRVKTGPREMWANEYPDRIGQACETLDEADRIACPHRIRVIRFREVTE